MVIFDETVYPLAVQQPSSIWVPERKGSYGDIVVDFADQHGISPDPEQRRDIDCLASYGPRGRWLTLETCVVEGRQNGKTKREILPVVLADFFVINMEPDRMVWTSHLMSTSLDTFGEVVGLVETYPDLSRRVKKIITDKTQEGIQLTDGSLLDFRARVGGGGRGLSGKRLVFDEALFIKPENLGALLPVLSSRENPQIMYASSPGKATSVHLQSLQRRGRLGNDPSLIYIEYKSPGGWDDPGCAAGLQCDHIYGNESNVVNGKGCVMDDPDNWRAANHSIQRGRIQIAFVDAESRALRQYPEGVLEFGRERMGWSELSGEEIDPDKIPQERWDAQTDPLSEIEGDVCFAVDMNPSASHVAIAAAGLRSDGTIHFGVVAYGRGTSWVADRLTELCKKHPTMCGVQWIPNSPIGALKTQLTNLPDVNMEEVSEVEYYAACGAFKDHILKGDAWHVGSEILDSAFEVSKRVVLPEGAWKFGRRKSSGDVSPLVAATLAVKGVDENAFNVPGVWEL